MQKYSPKFYAGIVLFVTSLIIGKITTATFLFYYDDTFLRWVSIIFYTISWPMLFIGVLWIGKEYARMLKKYFSVRYYGGHAVNGAKVVVKHTVKHGTRAVKGTIHHGKRAVAHGEKLRKKVVHHTIHRGKKAIKRTVENGRKLRSRVSSRK